MLENKLLIQKSIPALLYISVYTYLPKNIYKYASRILIQFQFNIYTYTNLGTENDILHAHQHHNYYFTFYKWGSSNMFTIYLTISLPTTQHYEYMTFYRAHILQINICADFIPNVFLNKKKKPPTYIWECLLVSYHCLFYAPNQTVHYHKGIG